LFGEPLVVRRAMPCAVIFVPHRRAVIGTFRSRIMTVRHPHTRAAFRFPRPGDGEINLA